MAFCTAVQENVTGLATPVALFAGASSDGAVPGHCGAGTVTAVVTETLLLDDFGSGLFEEIEALSVSVPAAEGAVPVMVIDEALPTEMAGVVQPTRFPCTAQFQPVPDALPKTTPLGRVLATTTFCAPVGPKLATLMTQVIGAPALTGGGAAVFVVTWSVSVPLGPALNVIAFVPCPAVMLPLAIDQV